MTFKNMLVCTDFSKDSKKALHVAIRLAKIDNGTIHCVHVLPKMEKRVYKVMRRAAQNDMEKFFPSNLYGQSNKEILFDDSKSQAIVKFAKAHDCDIIVLGSKGRRAIADLLLGSVTQQVIRLAHTAVLMVPHNFQEKLLMKNRSGTILVPMDFSSVSKKALSFAIRLAEHQQARVELLHVIDSRVILYVVQNEALAQIIDKRSKQEIQKELGRLSDASPLIDRPVVIAMGDPPREIINYAQRKSVNFIVMGSHGMKPLQRVLLGSVTATVLSKIKIPVITVSSRFRSPKKV